MTLQVHVIVQDAAYFDDPPVDNPIEKEVAPAPPMTRKVECADARHDLVTRLRPRRVGTARELPDRTDERVSVDPCLARAKILRCPFQDICEIELGDSGETNAPFRPGHRASSARA